MREIADDQQRKARRIKPPETEMQFVRQQERHEEQQRHRHRHKDAFGKADAGDGVMVFGVGEQQHQHGAERQRDDKTGQIGLFVRQPGGKSDHAGRKDDFQDGKEHGFASWINRVVRIC